ncbi:hypothetical protein HELRODRAFT_86081 [Helobdella robusta]|uniref:LRRCT domain-containing protein n=1 Tax=Helobdella robusta TaxID=6412 RepID=T1G670_HELRO|nr:hypothetical protein HELRODRAFT_86081 [Helobdella robusta]ESN96850.1 hypothetical protein HELRODRAFT_86081 [Helobdella robusta]
MSFVAHCASYCKVSTIKNMAAANCNNRSLRSVPNTLRDDLKIFDISYNHISRITSDSFKLYPLLHELRMTYNKIKFIEKNAFNGLAFLSILDLSNNELKDVPYDCLALLKSLSELKLDGNPIKLINPNFLELLQNLTELSLENCSLTHLEVDFFKNFNRLKSLNLAGNKLVTLNKDILPYLTKSEISFLKLNRNMWKCDCEMKWLRAWLVAAPTVWIDNEGGPTCQTGVQQVINRHWRDLKAEQFVCPLTIIAVGWLRDFLKFLSVNYVL